jgi:hypothetical protein
MEPRWLHFFELQSAFGAFTAFAGAFFTVFMVLGAAFAAVVFAVTCDRMIAKLAGAFRAVAGAFTVDHGSDSIVMVVRCDRCAPYYQCRS